VANTRKAQIPVKDLLFSVAVVVIGSKDGIPGKEKAIDPHPVPSVSNRWEDKHRPSQNTAKYDPYIS